MVIRDSFGDTVKGEQDQHAQHVDVDVKPCAEGRRDQEAVRSQPYLGERDVIARLRCERGTTSAVSPRKESGQSAGQRTASQPEGSTDDTYQADAAAPSGPSVQQPVVAGTTCGRPAPIVTNLSTSLVGSSPSQQRPRGWQAILPSPTQADDQGAAISDIDRSQSQLVSREPLPVLSPTADDETEKDSTQPGYDTAAAGSPAPAGPSSEDALAPGHVPGSSNTAATAARFSNLSIMSPAGSLPAGSGSGRPQFMVRPGLRIQPPPSPCDAGCVTPTGLLSPNAMARPYSGPRITEEELDYDLIDGIPAGEGSNTASSSSSPNPVGSAIYTRSGGLRSSRDHDLRRMAMTNQLLNSPRLPLLASATSGPAPMFTGDTRARALGNAGGVASLQPSEETPPAVVAGEGDSTAGSTPVSHAAQLQRLLQQSIRRQGYSPASVLSPPATSSSAPPSSTRSLPTTPAGSQHRLMASTAAPSSSRSSSMTGSPVPTPAMGPAAALLAGAVEASPRTPRSPLSVMYSPHSGRTVHTATGAPLPAPLFASVGPFGQSTPSAPAASPSFGAIGSAALPPSGRHSLTNISGSLFSPPNTSRLSRDSIGVSNSAQAATEGMETAQPMEEDREVQDLQPADPQQSGFMAAAGAPLALSIGRQPANLILQQQGAQQHLPQVLRQRLQVTDTRYGPHGESPLSPSHHAQLQHMQNLHQGDSLLSPSRPTPLVQPAVTAAATGQPDAAAAAAATPAAAHLVGDVGRRDVHEWLDQHSWTLQYELPRSLRDVADFARSHRRSATANSVLHEGRGSPLGQEQGPGQQGIVQSAELVGSVGGRPHSTMSRNVQPDHVAPQTHSSVSDDQLRAPGSADRPRQSSLQLPSSTAAYHATVPANVAAAATSGTAYDWFLGSFGLSIGQTGPEGASGLSGHTTNRSRLMQSDVHRSDQGSEAWGLFRPPPSRDADCSVEGVPPTGIHVVADSSMSGALRSAAAATRPYVDATAIQQMDATNHHGERAAVPFAGDQGSSTSSEAGQSAVITHANRPNIMVSSNSARSSSAAGSSTRLLSPGSHLYMPGSPVAEHSCCNTCQPTAALGATASAGGALHPAAEFLRSSMAAQAAGQGAEQTSRLASPSSTNSPSQCQQIPVTSCAAIDAAIEITPGQLRSHSVTAAVSTAPQQHLQHSETSLSTILTAAAHVQPGMKGAASAPTHDSCCMQKATVRSKIVQHEATQVGQSYGMALTGSMSPCANPVHLLLLLRNRGYMQWLLSTLPGVDPGSLELQHVISHLQSTLEQQSDRSHQQGNAGHI